MSEIRINARFDEKTANDLQFLRKVLGNTSITDVLKHSIQQMAQEQRDKIRAKHQKQLWKDSGLIACIDNEHENLSSDYKKYVNHYLDEKHAQHISKK